MKRYCRYNNLCNRVISVVSVKFLWKSSPKSLVFTFRFSFNSVPTVSTRSNRGKGNKEFTQTTTTASCARLPNNYANE